MQHPAQERAGRVAAGLVDVIVADDGALTYKLDRSKLRALRQREGRYLLRSNLAADDPELIWRCYIQLCQVEEAFRTLKGNLGLRPIFHRKPERIEAHLFVRRLRYTKPKKVGVEIVRSLYGVVEQQSATKGVIATSYFTKEAKEFHNDKQYRLGLADFNSLCAMLTEWKMGKS